jgi:hypothetical protein
VLPVIADLPPLRSAGPEELLAFRAGALRFTAPASLAGRPELVSPGGRQGRYKWSPAGMWSVAAIVPRNTPLM